MKSTLVVTVATLAWTLAGCGGGGGKNKDLAAPADLSGADRAAMVNCTALSTWPGNDVTYRGQANPIQGFDFVTAAYEHRPNATMASLDDELRIEVWDPSGMPQTYPTTFTFTTSGQYNTCTGCLSLSIGRDPANPTATPGEFFFAVDGSMTVTKADRDPASGDFAATGTNVHLVQWSYYDAAMSDSPIADGACYDIASFSVSGSYMNSLDGGTTD
jgi:hypothetical protein